MTDNNHTAASNFAHSQLGAKSVRWDLPDSGGAVRKRRGSIMVCVLVVVLLVVLLSAQTLQTITVMGRANRHQQRVEQAREMIEIGRNRLSEMQPGTEDVVRWEFHGDPIEMVLYKGETVDVDASQSEPLGGSSRVQVKVAVDQPHELVVSWSAP